MPSAPYRLRNQSAPRRSALLAFCVCLLSSCFAFSQVQVLTEHNDVSRSGANTNETLLTTTNVNFNAFGKLFTQSLDGFVVGQPLYLSAVAFPDGSTHNVVYVATQHDSVFAFDGDTDQAALWKVSFINPAAGITTVPISDFGCAGTAFTEIGIVSTPVIDPVAGTLFVLAKTLENGGYVFRLHALSVTTGADVVPPTVIAASVSTNSRTLQFNPSIQMQRPALLLENGTIYIGFGSNGCDTYAYNGWLLAYSETSLQQVGIFVDTPNGRQGALWQAGGGPAADTDGTIFLATANGTFDANTGGSDYGDTMLHLSSASSGLTVLDSFTPFDQETMFLNDLDLGSGGVTLLPDQSPPHIHEMVGGGKEGTLYLVDRDNMGGFNAAGDTQIVQSIPGASTGELDSVPAYWNGSVYIGGQGDHIKAFSLSNALLSPQPTSQTSLSAIVPGSVSISSNGSNNGILWAIPENNPAVFYAFDASNLSTVLYSSVQAGTRDALGVTPKFVAPTVANGRVYIGGVSALTAYGFLPLISPIAGNNQSAYAGTTLPLSLQVQAVDAYQGNPIANASVTCKDGGVGGTFSAVMPMVTDGQGQASTSYTLPKRSQTITITCTSTGFATGTFSESDVAGPVTRAIIISGNKQTGPVSMPLPAALVAQVVDPYGYGVPGVSVTFSDGGAGGAFSAASVITDSIGEASAVYTTPTNPGTVTITASTSGLTSLKFSEVVTSTLPGFTLSPAPGTLSIAQGANGTTMITLNPLNGFTGSVNLAASGLPSGVTASFSANPATTTSILTLTATSSATTGPATVTVTGTSGSLTQSTTINLTVTGTPPPTPSYSLSTGIDSASVSPGGTVQATVTATPANGYTGNVTLSCTVTSTVTFTPSQATCSFGNTSPVTVASNGGTATVTFSTVAQAAMMLPRSNLFYALWLPFPGMALIGLGLGSKGRRSRKLLSLALLWVVLAGLLVLPACSAAGSAGGGHGGTGATPAGVYTVTITGEDANSVTQSNPAPVVSITVN
jgi:hypothetical protein